MLRPAGFAQASKELARLCADGGGSADPRAVPPAAVRKMQGAHADGVRELQAVFARVNALARPRRVSES